MTNKAIDLAAPDRQTSKGMPFRAMLGSLAARWQLSRDVAVLRSQPDHILRDMGLTRDGISEAVLHGRGRDP